MISENMMTDDEFLEYLRDRFDELDESGGSISQFIEEAVKATEIRAARQIVDAIKRELEAE